MTKRWAISIMMLLLFSLPACDSDDKGVWKGDFYLKNNTDMRNISRYSSITGDLIIEPQLMDDPLGEFFYLEHTEDGKAIAPMLMLSLSDLENITRIGGSLIIRHTSFITLDGLENIETIGKDLVVDRNHILRRMDGLASLTSVGGSVAISKNGTLFSLGMDQLSAIGNDLMVDDNPFLPVSEMERLVEQIGEENIGGEITFQ
jgi:hypothetical protein